MLGEVTWPQLVEWMTYSELEPFDELRSDLRTAQITAAILNVNRAKSKPATSAAEVRLRFGDDDRREQTWQQQKAIGQMYASMFNREAKKKQPRGVTVGPGQKRVPRRKV